MTICLIYLGPGFDSRHLHQLFNNMQKLFENWRRYLNEADIDNDGLSDEAETSIHPNSIESQPVQGNLNVRTIGDLRRIINKAKTAKRKQQASSEIQQAATGAAKGGFFTALGSALGFPLAQIASVGELIVKAYKLPDEKITGTGLDQLQIDPEISAIVANDVENNFLNTISDRLKQLPDETLLQNVNINKLLRDFISANYDQRTITSPDLESN